ncbi:hypothetical protein H5T89_11655, partial [bacterium]|nr:hypothetical protein [bacterium]
MAIPIVEKLIRQLGIDLDTQSYKNNKGLSFLEVLNAKLDGEDVELVFPLQKIEKGAKKIEIDNNIYYLFNYVYSNPTFFPQVSSLLGKEEINLLLKNQEVTKQIADIISLMRPGDEVSLNVDNREIVLKKDLQSQVYILVNDKDFEDEITIATTAQATYREEKLQGVRDKTYKDIETSNLVEAPKDRIATEITQGIDRGIQDSKGRIDATRIVQDIGRDLVE